MRFKVFVDDNFHYHDEDERYLLAEFDSYEEALSTAKAVVEKSIANELQPGISAEALYDRYTSFGEDPFISPEPGAQHFSGWDYAKARCEEICPSTKS